MRLALVILAACGRLDFTPVAAVDAPPDTSITASALAHWPFDDNAGMTAADVTGHGYTMALTNDPLWVSGEFGSAIQSTGTAEFLETPTLDLSNTQAVTVSLWINRTYSSVSGHTLFELTTNLNLNSVGFALFPDDTSACTGQVLVALQGDAGQNLRCYDQPTSDTWHHLVAVYDKSQPAAGEVALYLDGTLQTSTSQRLNDNTNTFAVAPLFVFSRGGASEFNAGILDEMALWDRALSPAEIAGL